MTPIKRRLLYIFRDDLLRLRITWEVGSITLSTGYHITRKDAKGRAIWDGSRCKANTTHGKDKIPATVINKILQNLEDKVEKAFYHFEMADRTPSKQQLKAFIKEDGKPEEKDFEIALNEFMAENSASQQWSEGSVRQYNVIKKIILFAHQQIDLSFSKLTADTQRQIIQCLTTATSSSKRGRFLSDTDNSGYQNTTINNVLNIFRSFIKWAYNKGYVDDIRAISKPLSLKTANRPVIYLTWDELLSIYNHDFSINPILDQAKDIFMFACFTSLRYSDIQKARWEDLRDGILRVSIKKTGKYVDIDLNKYSSALIQKQRAKQPLPDGRIFPRIPNTTLNNRIQAICKICEIDTPVSLQHQIGANRYEYTQPKYKYISIHSGRKTFIVNALSMGIPPRIVMEWTGHSDYNAMRPYIAITDDSRREAMKKFDLPQNPLQE